MDNSKRINKEKIIIGIIFLLIVGLILLIELNIIKPFWVLAMGFVVIVVILMIGGKKGIKF